MDQWLIIRGQSMDNPVLLFLSGGAGGTEAGRVLHSAQERPDLFHAYIGTGQMVNVRETDQTIYRMLMEHAQQVGDTELSEMLEVQGEPPYFGNNPLSRYRNVLGREYNIFELPYIQSEAYRREGDALLLILRRPEYDWLDRINTMSGLIDTFNVVYPQLQDFDFRDDAQELDLPNLYHPGPS